MILPRVRVQVHNPRDTYFEGDTIKGDVVVTDVVGKVCIKGLRVGLECAEYVNASNDYLSSNVLYRLSVINVPKQTVSGVVSFAFSVDVPNSDKTSYYPPSFKLDDKRVSRCEIWWGIYAILNLELKGSVRTLEHMRPLQVYPSVSHLNQSQYEYWGPPREISIRIPKPLPQGPGVCDITVQYEPRRPTWVDQIEVFVEMCTATWQEEKACVVRSRVELETVEVHERVSGKLELSGLRRQWRLNRRLSPEFTSRRMTVQYSLVVIVKTSATEKVQLRDMTVRICPPTNAQAIEEGHVTPPPYYTP